MYTFLCKLFIKDYQETDKPEVRESYGTIISIFSIICNILMVIFKLLVSIATGSVSIRADAFNNLSDVGSNLASLFGFKMAGKHPDRDHPYGHGRMEYISGLIIAFLILFMGFSALKDAVSAIIAGSNLDFNLIAIVVLLVSIGIKMVMWHVNSQAGQDISSDTLSAAGQDSLNDALMTLSTLACLLVYRFFKINIDAYVGLVVAILVLKSGAGIFMDVSATILGKAPDGELVKEIEKLTMSKEHVIGIHDLILHDYGPANQFMTFHVEVPADEDLLMLHDMIDNLEKEILEKYGILTTIHLDPVDTSDGLTKELKAIAIRVVKDINNEYGIHDFRIVKGPTHTNLIFDVLLPADDRRDESELKKLIEEGIRKENDTYYCVIEIDHSYV